jgi:hypothetical protein
MSAHRSSGVRAFFPRSIAAIAPGVASVLGKFEN